MEWNWNGKEKDNVQTISHRVQKSNTTYNLINKILFRFNKVLYFTYSLYNFTKDLSYIHIEFTFNGPTTEDRKSTHLGY